MRWLTPHSSMITSNAIAAHRLYMAMFGERLAPDGSLVADNFARFFDGSAVVDDEGVPLRLFHGTPSGGFTRFLRAFEGSNSGAASPGHGLGGFYFTADPATADTYARTVDLETIDFCERNGFGHSAIKRPSGPAIYPVYVVMRNPLSVSRAITLSDVERAKALGHDGIILRTGSGFTEYMVPDARRVKSATGNSGMFSPDHADLADAWAWQTPAARATAAARAVELARERVAPRP